MHEESDFQILAECEHGYIGMCTCCREFNLAYKNILLSFPEEDMFRFCSWLSEGRSNPCTQLPMRHGRNKVYATPMNNFYLAFDVEELNDIERLAAEARLILDARRITMYW